MEEQEMVKVEYVIPAELQKVIAEKIASEVKSSYLYNTARAVSEKVREALEDDGFSDRISDAVVKKITMSEDEYISGVSAQVKDALMQTTGIIAKTVLEKVNEKVQSYGFIKIGSKGY